MQRSARIKRELKMLTDNPPENISCWAIEDKIDNLSAQILGTVDTPYTGGCFKVTIQIPERYPFEPPSVRFCTPIYHPNIDNEGRICLDLLKMPPQGAWKPSINLSTLLTSLRILMNEPNPDDPLMADIAEEFRYNLPKFKAKARDWTKKHATQLPESSAAATEHLDGGSSRQSSKRVSSDSSPDGSDFKKLKSSTCTNTD